MSKRFNRTAPFDSLTFDEVKSVAHALCEIAFAGPGTSPQLPRDRTGIVDVDTDGSFRERSLAEMCKWLDTGPIDLPISFNTRDVFSFLSLIRSEIKSAEELDDNGMLTASLADELSRTLQDILAAPGSDEQIGSQLLEAENLITKSLWLGMAFQRFLLKRAEEASKYGTNHQRKLEENRRKRKPTVTLEQINEAVKRKQSKNKRLSLTRARELATQELGISMSTLYRIIGSKKNKKK